MLRPASLEFYKVEGGFARIDFAQNVLGPVVPVVEEPEPALRERLFDCEHFRLWRVRSDAPFTVGADAMPRVLVCIDGEGHVKYDGADYSCEKGDAMLLPAVVGACMFHPRGSISLLEIS